MKKLLKTLADVKFKEEWKEKILLLRETSIKYIVSVEKIKGALVLNFFNMEEVLKYRVLLNKTDYITKEYIQETIRETVKIRTGSLENILGYDWNRHCFFADDVSFKRLARFLNKDAVSFKDVFLLQQDIMAKKLEEKHKKENAAVDLKMSEIKALPKGFKKWINDEALKESRYVFYEYTTKKNVKGFCTHCKKDVILDKTSQAVKHNEKGVCPNCKSNIYFKSIGKAGVVRDTGKASLIQKSRDGIVIRHFFAYKTYDNYRTPCLEYSELARYFYSGDGKVDAYEYRRYKQTGIVRWCKGISSSGLNYSDMYDFYNVTLYTKNLSCELKNTFWMYSAIKEYADMNEKFCVDNYLGKYYVFPGLEYLTKLKLPNLVADIISNFYYNAYKYSNRKPTINYQSHSIFEILNINKSQLKILQETNGGLGAVEIIQNINTTGLKVSEEEVKYLISVGADINKLSLIARYTTVYKAIKYIKEQCNGIGNFKYFTSDWLDYINDCESLGFDLSKNLVLMPRDLQQAHHTTGMLVKVQKNKLLDKGIKKICKKLTKDFSWEYKDYAFVLPKSYSDLIKEGDTLNHCVARNGYAGSMIEGKLCIVFLRKKESIKAPFYTVEIDMERRDIVQCRGYSNKSAEGEIKEIVDMFKKTKLLSKAS